MSKRIHLLALLLALAASPPARANPAADAPAARGATLAGRVTDAAGRGVPAVSVTVTELRRGTLTDAEGRYEIPALPPSTVHVAFQRLGYAPLVRHIVLAPGPMSLDVTLAESAIELPAAQVSAAANPSTPLESPQPVTVLESAALRQAARPSLGATLEHLPGLRNWSTGSGIGKPVIRGLRADRVLVAADELRLENQGWGDEHGPQVETADVERIEVIRGPAGVLYGADALGGVVHVIPRPLPVAFDRAPFVAGRAHGAAATGDGLAEGGGSIEGAAGGLGARLSGTVRESGDVRTPAGDLANSGNRAATGSAAFALRGAWGSLGGSYARRNERIEIHEDPAEDPDATPYQRIADDLGRVSAMFPLARASRLELHVGAQQNLRREFEAADDDAVAVGLRARTYSALAQIHHGRLGPIEGLVGVSYQRTRFTIFGEESLVPASTGFDAAAFAFEELALGRWHLAFGARYDHRSLDVEDDAALGVTAQSRQWDAVSGNVGALYRLSSPVALVANVGRGFRAPSNFDLFANGVHEGTVAFERGNPSLDVETSLNADVAVRVQVPLARAEIGGFVNEIHDFIYTRPTGLTDPGSGFEIFDVVQGDARLSGLELSLELHPERHLHVSVTADVVRGDNRDTRTPLPWIPPARIVYGVRYEPDPVGPLEHVHVGVRAESVAEPKRLDPLDTGVPGYTLVHAEAGVTLPAGRRALVLDVAIHNLLDRDHRDFLSRYKTYAQSPGRSARARLTATF